DGALATNDFTNFTTVQTFRGGYLAQPTNIGRFSRDTFAVVPELNLSVGWQPRDWLTLTVGYNFLYLSDVLRPGDQIDRPINPTQGPAFVGDPSQPLVGPARPRFTPQSTDVFFHGVSAGLEVRF